jgi:RNA polymerase sigma-70 factor, ECF subfamily
MQPAGPSVRLTDMNTSRDSFPEVPAAISGGFCFHDALVELLPRLRIQALSLTRNRTEAEDLVQVAVANALAAQVSFTPGTHLGAWMYRILRNRFISDRRRQRDTVEMDDAPAEAFARPGNQEDNIALGELRRAMAHLPEEQRVALVMVAVQGMSYEEVAKVMRCAVGTAKCRVFRARRALEARLLGEPPAQRTSTARRLTAGAPAPAPRSMRAAGDGRRAATTGFDAPA